jgi:hypothetical protein
LLFKALVTIFQHCKIVSTITGNVPMSQAIEYSRSVELETIFENRAMNTVMTIRTIASMYIARPATQGTVNNKKRTALRIREPHSELDFPFVELQQLQEVSRLLHLFQHAGFDSPSGFCSETCVSSSANNWPLRGSRLPLSLIQK